MRMVIAILMALHGVAHIVGFVGSWRLMSATGAPYTTTILAGQRNIGDAGERALGVLWLFAAIAFEAAAAGVLMSRGWWFSLAIWTSLASLALSALAWPVTRIGVFVNLVIVVALLLGRWLAWL